MFENQKIEIGKSFPLKKGNMSKSESNREKSVCWSNSDYAITVRGCSHERDEYTSSFLVVTWRNLQLKLIHEKTADYVLFVMQNKEATRKKK